MLHSFFLITFFIIFGIAVFTILFKTISSFILSSRVDKKPKNHSRNKRRTYNHSFASNSNDDFMRQAERMHDMARQDHERMHNGFMSNTICMNKDFMNNMNMHNMM